MWLVQSGEISSANHARYPILLHFVLFTFQFPLFTSAPDSFFILHRRTDPIPDTRTVLVRSPARKAHQIALLSPIWAGGRISRNSPFFVGSVGNRRTKVGMTCTMSVRSGRFRAPIAFRQGWAILSGKSRRLASIR